MAFLERRFRHISNRKLIIGWACSTPPVAYNVPPGYFPSGGLGLILIILIILLLMGRI